MLLGLALCLLYVFATFSPSKLFFGLPSSLLQKFDTDPHRGAHHRQYPTGRRQKSWYVCCSQCLRLCIDTFSLRNSLKLNAELVQNIQQKEAIRLICICVNQKKTLNPNPSIQCPSISLQITALPIHIQVHFTYD